MAEQFNSRQLSQIESKGSESMINSYRQLGLQVLEITGVRGIEGLSPEERIRLNYVLNEARLEVTTIKSFLHGLRMGIKGPEESEWLNENSESGLLTVKGESFDLSVYFKQDKLI